MSELINSQEVFAALSQGRDVLWRSPEWSTTDTWHSLLTGLLLTAEEIATATYHREDTGSDQKIVFKIAPQTITINGIELPAPFKPKEGEKFWFIHSDSSLRYESYIRGSVEEVYQQYGAWRTEEEIIHVSAALKNIFQIDRPSG